MDITILCAKVLGIYMMVSGLMLIVKGKSLTILLKDFFDHPALIYLTGVILIFLSSIYLLQYNIWNGTFNIVVTLFAWLVLLKGLAYIFAPKLLSEISVKKYQKYFALYGIIAILVGLFLFFIK